MTGTIVPRQPRSLIVRAMFAGIGHRPRGAAWIRTDDFPRTTVGPGESRGVEEESKRVEKDLPR